MLASTGVAATVGLAAAEAVDALPLDELVDEEDSEYVDPLVLASTVAVVELVPTEVPPVEVEVEVVSEYTDPWVVASTELDVEPDAAEVVAVEAELVSPVALTVPT